MCITHPHSIGAGDVDRGSELYSARTDVLLLLPVFGPEQKVVLDHLQTGGADNHNYADLADGCTLLDCLLRYIEGCFYGVSFVVVLLRCCRCSRSSIVRLFIISTSRSRCATAQYCP